MGNDVFLEACKTRIESRLAWGSSKDWTTRDFAGLSEQILAETGVQLSPTTLKRIWGKIDYQSVPHPDTLNALAGFAGFENWRSLKLKDNASVFLQKTNGEGSDIRRSKLVDSPEASLLDVPNRPIIFAKKRFIALVLIAVAASFGAFKCWQTLRLSPDDFEFSSRIVTVGIPNSVIFKYDAGASPPGDSVFIQQSWDARRRVAVPRNGHEHTSIYYRPGYFMAKLVVGNKVVLEHKLFVPTDGWLGFIEQSPVPVYLDHTEFDRDSCLEIRPETVTAHHIALFPEAPTVRLTEVRDYGDLTTADFLFEAEVRNLFDEGSAICRMTEVVLLTSRGSLAIPLAAPGCVGALVLHVPHQNIEASQADLSGFGCDLGQWTAVRCGSQQDKIFIEVNGKTAYSLTWPGERPAEIIGLEFNFKGGGAVRRIRLSKPSSNYQIKSSTASDPFPIPSAFGANSSKTVQ